MNTRTRLLIALLAVCWFCRPTAAAAQYAGSLAQPGYVSPVFVPSPTVSPYLNLLTNPNPGVTNYQTVVRPMIDERDAMAARPGMPTTSSQARPQQGHAQAAGKHPPEDRQAARFFDYSHYYGPARR